MLQLYLICGGCIMILIAFYLSWWRSSIKGVPMFKPVFPWGHVWYVVQKPAVSYISLLSHVYQFFLASSCLFEEGIFYFRLFIYDFVFLTSPETVQEVFLNTKEFMKADVYKPLKRIAGEGLITTNDQVIYKAHRKVILQTFSNNMLERFQSIFSRKASILCEILSLKDHDKPINISNLIPLCTYDIIFEIICGQDIEAQKYPDLEIIEVSENFLDHVTESILKMWKNNTIIKMLFQSEVKAEIKFKWLDEFYRKVVNERKELVAEEVMRLTTGEEYRGSDDRPCLLDLLLRQNLKKHQLFTEKLVVDEVQTLMAAGFDTTSISLKWIFFYIGNYPKVQEKVQKELDDIFGLERERIITTDDLNSMKYLTMVIKESQRLHPAVPIIARQLSNDMKIGGRKIPKGTRIALFIGAIHMDPKHYANPGEFIPERFSPENSSNRHPFAFIPFSAGQRNCPGAVFATRSMLTVTACVLRKFSIQSVLKRDQIGTHWGITGSPNQDIEFYFRLRK